jgi:large subunit ribosomal protein L22
MGARKQQSAKLRRKSQAATCVAKLTARPTSPRKMRLVVDAIRGMEVERALNVLTYTRKECASDIRKVLLSAINNWEQKFGNSTDSDLYIKEAKVDCGTILKRFQPAPMGRAYRIRKRSNHLTIELGSKSGVAQSEEIEQQDNSNE